jgi:hypothetical protein
VGPAHQGSRHFCGLIAAFHNVRSVNGCPHAMTVFCTYHNGRFLRPRGARDQGPNHDGTARWYLYLMLLRSSFMLAKASKRNRGSPPTMRMRRRSFFTRRWAGGGRWKVFAADFKFYQPIRYPKSSLV